MFTTSRFTSEKLNPEQNAAVEAIDGPCLVIAGPGSGKTRTLCEKALHILRHSRDARILCITHTRKATDEMRAGIRRYPATRAIEISTIHSLCYRILKRGTAKPIRIVSPYEQATMVRLAAERALLDIDHRRAGFLISQAKLGLVEKTDDTSRLLKEYNKLKGNRLDYDDLPLLVVKKLWRDTDAKRIWTHTLVDEAQDLDPVQITLVKRLAGRRPNISFFLDANQSIFSFKGAMPEQVATLASIYPNTRQFLLLTNHRSTRRILESANRLIQINGSDNPSVPIRNEGDYPLWIETPDESGEAELAAELVEKLIQDGIKPREIIILYRVNHYRAEIEYELIEREIPYSVLKNTSIFKNEGSFLPLCLEVWRPKHCSETALLVNYIGRRMTDEISSLSRELGLRPLEAAIQEGIRRPGIQRRTELLLRDLREIGRLRDKAPALLAEAVCEIIQKRGFIVDSGELKGIVRIMQRMDSLGELAEAVERLEILNKGPRENKVHLSTIHRAKGLEHKAVILLGCVEGMLPLRVGDELNLAEERRLAYVALTRAKDLFVAISPRVLYEEKTAPSRFIAEMGLKKARWIQQPAEAPL